jgi:hemoglobin
MRDIETRTDIEKLMTAFYDKAYANESIGFYFTEVTHLNLAKHLPVIIDFWESVLLDNQVYFNNALKAHEHIHKLHPFKSEDFNVWVRLFCESIDELFVGAIAEKAKQKAESVSSAMKMIFIHQGNR